MKPNTTKLLGILSLTGALTACTGILPDSFRYQQEKETLASTTKINTKIDLLWVVDNSSSMDIAQKSIREKVASFAESYLSPNWNIRIGVITTDTYLANDRFQAWRQGAVSGSTNYRSKHLSDRLAVLNATGQNAGNNERIALLQSMGVTLGNHATPGLFTTGFKWQDLVPAWRLGRDYARLISGAHDGPIEALCIERQGYFIAENDPGQPDISGPNCKERDFSADTGVDKCLEGGAESVEQCVNTLLNNTVRSANPIISTQLQDGYTVEEWKAKLTADFMVNISVGSTGNGSERGLGSLVEFLEVNETSASAFFRSDSLRGIVFLADEDDQTTTLPSSFPGGYNPSVTDYKCDLDALVEANTDKWGSDAAAETYIASTYKFCCADGSCLYRDADGRGDTEGCPAKVVDGETFKVGVCPSATRAVSSLKSDIDAFFASLDAGQELPDGATPGAYFAVAIVPTTAASINDLRTQRYQSDDRLDDIQFYSSGSVVTQDRLRIPAVDEGTRYKEFAEAVGGHSLVYDIGNSEYGVILDAIGRTLVEQKSRFPLKFAPTAKEDMIVKIIRGNGDERVLGADEYEFEGKTLILVDEALVLSLSEEDRIYADYQPESLD
jgi:hypothetical protein